MAIGDDAADQREQQDRQLAEERVEAEVEGRESPKREHAASLWATFCIHVPEVDRTLAPHSSRKSGEVSADTSRIIPRCGGGVATSGVDASDCAGSAGEGETATC